MFSAFYEAFISEIKSIKASWYKLFLLTVLPLLSFTLIIAIFHAGVARDLPLVIVDQDHSKLSRVLVQNIDASPTMHIGYRANSVKEALHLVQETKAYGLVVIPKYFEKNTLLHKSPTITAMLNTQYILIGKILTSALSRTVMYSDGTVEYLQLLVEEQNPGAAKHAMAPIHMQVTPFFNTYQSYFYFLVSALLPAIWQIFIVIATLVSVGVMFKARKERLFFQGTEHVAVKLLGLMLPYTIAFMLLGMGSVMYLYSMWEFQGSFTVLFLGMFLTVVGYQCIALLLFSTGFDYARSLSLGAVYTAPAFAFLGITFPAYSMTGFALFWRDMLPVSHYTQLQLSQANYGLDIWQEFDKLATLGAFWLLFIPVVFLFKKRLLKKEIAKDMS